MDEPRFEISCEGLVIGHSALKPRAGVPSVLHGLFTPTAAFARVAPLFRAEAVARARPEDDADGEALLRAFYVARDQLKFRVLDGAGQEVPVEYLHVYAPLTPEASTPELLVRLAACDP